MLMNLRNAMMAGKRLPYDAELEYLESTGTQYIDTGIYAKSTHTFKCVITPVTRRINGMVFWGAAKGDGSTGLGDAVYLCDRYGYTGSMNFVDTYNSANYVSFTYGEELTIECVVAGGKLTVNGTSASYATYNLSGTAQYPIFIGANNLGGSAFRNASARYHSFKVYDGDSLVRDFIPVRKGTVGYLYDRVTGKLFGNAGSGDFAYGSDVVPVEYLESTGTQRINTQYTIGSTTRVRTRVAMSSDNAGRMGCIGNSARFYFGSMSGQWAAAVNSAVYNHSLGAADTDIHDFEIGSRGFFIDGVKKLDSGTSYSNIEFWVFYTAGLGAYLTGRVYSAKFYNGDTLDRSFRPVRVGTGSTWVGAMMDVLTRRVYRNAGTGAFTYGNDLRYPIPTE